ncbi:MAG TPA: SAM-dependent methyltransferase, partial [Phycisphaerae bacterium]|nr:SAM-dependent methyltransferase [Phycisphaerae bacterium]
MNEWEFTADVASWINELLQKDRNLPFSRAKCEQRGKGSLKRRDLTLLDKSQRVVLTGEVKLPYRKDGGSPYNSSVVSDARRKAARAKAPFFFTWNVNECVLWETVPPRTSWKDQNYKSWDVTSVHKESHMLLPMTLHAIQIWLPTFLNDLAQILHGTTEIGRKSPDEKFIEALESSLQLPILLTIEELVNRYKKSRLRTELDKWMRDEQGWIIYDDPEGIRDNLERTAKFTCYAMVNKLVFY